MEDPLTTLADLLRTPALLVGVGNPLRGDDGVGPYFAERLLAAGGAVGSSGPNGRIGKNRAWSAINAEDIPESYVFTLADSAVETVIFVDAVLGCREPGDLLLADLTGIESAGLDLSTHKLALSLCGKFLRASGKRTYLLGIGAGDVDFGSSLTAEVQGTADRLTDWILDLDASGRRPHNAI